jgi:hypothetical protein
MSLSLQSVAIHAVVLFGFAGLTVASGGSKSVSTQSVQESYLMECIDENCSGGEVAELHEWYSEECVYETCKGEEVFELGGGEIVESSFWAFEEWGSDSGSRPGGGNTSLERMLSDWQQRGWYYDNRLRGVEQAHHIDHYGHESYEDEMVREEDHWEWVN